MYLSNSKKVFDWNKAARLIREQKPVEARAGLKEDWFWTGGTICRSGEVVTDDNTYLASSWATPVLLLDDGDFLDCFVGSGETDWTAETKWPMSALEILLGVNE